MQGQFATVENLTNCQAALDWFYDRFIRRPEKPPVTPESSLIPSPELEDEEILELLRRSKLRPDFERLYDDGNLSGDHSTNDLRLCSMLGFYTQDAEQIDRIFRQSALMRAKWERTDYRNSTIQKALDGLTATYQPPQTRQRTAYGLTELEAARRFLDSETAETFRVLRQARSPKTMRFNGAVWVEDRHQHELLKAVGDISKVILLEMAEELDTGRRDKLYVLAKRLETRRGLQDVTDLVIMNLLEFRPQNADAEDVMLCVKNGVVWLPYGVLLAHSVDWLFTRQSPVIYDEGAECKQWLKFIAEFCCFDKGLMKLLQVYFGYSLSGYTSEHKMLIFHGFGRNGKSVLLEVIRAIFGDFTTVMPSDALLQRRSEQTNDLMLLEGVRLAVLSEINENQPLDEAKTKSVTGESEIVARQLYENNTRFKQRACLAVSTNHKPKVTGTDLGIWSRLVLFPCNAKVTNPNKNLAEELKTEGSGILNWLLEGYRLWEAEGLTIPDSVKAVTAEYRKECDTVGRFIQDACNMNLVDLKASAVYQAYRRWCDQEGHNPLAQVRFGQKLSEHGYPSEKRPSVMYYPHNLTCPK